MWAPPEFPSFALRTDALASPRNDVLIWVVTLRITMWVYELILLENTFSYLCSVCRVLYLGQCTAASPTCPLAPQAYSAIVESIYNYRLASSGQRHLLDWPI